MKLGEVCDIYAGQSAPQGDENYSSQGTPFIKAGNLEALTSGELESNIQQVSEGVAKSHKLVKYKKGSVVFAKSGMSCMKGYIYTLQGDCYVVSHLAILTPKQIESSYLNYCLQIYKPCSLAKEAAFPSITLKELSSFEVPVPTISEQQRIVALLDAEFAKIDALKANAEKNLQNAKDLFQAALKKELEPKEGWSATTISNVSKSSENIKWKNVIASEKFKYIDLTSVDRSSHSIVDPQIITSQNAPSRAQRIVKTNDVIFATTRPTLRRLCIISKEYDGNICSTGFCVIRPHLSVLPKWIYYNLSTEEFYDYVEPLQTGATYPAITDNDIRNYTIYLPSIEDQQSIVSRIDTLNEKCKALQANYEKTLSLCDDLKQALLRKAFNGEI